MMNQTANNKHTDEHLKNCMHKKRTRAKWIGIITSILMVIAGFACIINPLETIFVAQIIMSIGIIIFGIFICVDYFSSPLPFKDALSLLGGIISIIAGFYLLFAPRIVAVASFALIFGIILLFLGIMKLQSATALKMLTAKNHMWAIVCGFLYIVAALAFVFMPGISTLVFNYALAGFLIFGGIVLFIESLFLKSSNENCE